MSKHREEPNPQDVCAVLEGHGIFSKSQLPVKLHRIKPGTRDLHDFGFNYFFSSAKVTCHLLHQASVSLICLFRDYHALCLPSCIWPWWSAVISEDVCSSEDLQEVIEIYVPLCWSTDRHLGTKTLIGKLAKIHPAVQLREFCPLNSWETSLSSLQ